MKDFIIKGGEVMLEKRLLSLRVFMFSVCITYLTRVQTPALPNFWILSLEETDHTAVV